MKLTLLLGLLLLTVNSFALPDCIVEENSEFPYRVYDDESNLKLGTSGYSTMDLCQKAIHTKDFRIVCAPLSKLGEVGSVITSTRTGEPVGFKHDPYFTSVDFCSEAINNTRGNTVCVPGPNANVMSLIDFQKNVVLGVPFSSISFCKWASLSASFSGSDSYICAMNPKGNAEILDRSTGKWTGLPFVKTKECYDFLENWRKKQRKS